MAQILNSFDCRWAFSVNFPSSSKDPRPQALVSRLRYKGAGSYSKCSHQVLYAIQTAQQRIREIVNLDLLKPLMCGSI
jgi:hypothetical protein